MAKIFEENLRVLFGVVALVLLARAAHAHTNRGIVIYRQMGTVEQRGASLKMNRPAQVRAFLDLDQRPGAEPVSLSSAQITVWVDPEQSGQDIFRFEGQLGAIPASDSKRGYVGFTGIEMDSGLLVGDLVSSQEQVVEFEIRQLRPLSLNLTAQLVVEENLKLFTFESDFFQMDARSTWVNLPFDKFLRSYRGQTGTERYRGQGLIRKLRIFSKRSKNYPESIDPIAIFFEIPSKSLSISKPLGFRK
jgi:hypothetical protein